MNTASLIKGTDVTLTFHVRDEDDVPVNLTGATEINVKLPGNGGTTAVERKLSDLNVTVVSAVLGKISVALTDTITDTLNAGQQQDVEIVIDVGSTRTIAKAAKALSVFSRQFT